MRPAWNIGCRNLTSLIIFLTASLALLFLPAESRPSRTPGDDFVRFSKPEFLSFDELVEAEQKDPLPPELAKKLEILVATPIVSNEAYYEGAKPKHPLLPSSDRIFAPFSGISNAAFNLTPFASPFRNRTSLTRSLPRGRIPKPNLSHQMNSKSSSSSSIFCSLPIC